MEFEIVDLVDLPYKIGRLHKFWYTKVGLKQKSAHSLTI
jgi:hypothetical protein